MGILRTQKVAEQVVESLPSSDTAQITSRLMEHVRCSSSRCIVLPNIYIGGSPWESDVVRITASFYWTEYEVKVSRADYLADFKKQAADWGSSENKHDFYSDKQGREGPVVRNKQPIPRPKQFYFVTPPGLISIGELPNHCGLIEVDPTKLTVRFARVAPNLKNPTKLPPKAIFSVAQKASFRIRTNPQRRAR